MAQQNNILTASETMSHEYCASVIRIGELEPIQGSDFLVQTKVAGFNVVIRKGEVKTGDIMFYAANETMLDSDFVGTNNMYEPSVYHMNANGSEVDELKSELESFMCLNTDEDKIRRKKEEINAKIKSLCGFFNKHGRVKLIRLRKCPSYGFIFSTETMAKYCPEIRNVDLEALIDNPSGIYDFDTVNGKKFIQVYMPPQPERKVYTKFEKKHKKLKKFDRIIPGEFMFHYDTQQLNKNMYAINPTDVVSITLKIHGTSICIGNILTNKTWRCNTGIRSLDKPLNYMYQNFIPNKWKPVKKAYDVIYSSRTVIKNKYENPDSKGFYDVDVWTKYYNILKGVIPEGIMLYGEIIGYQGDGGKFIQKNYDYSCHPNTNKMMIYRVVENRPDGKKHEYNVTEVYDFTIDLIGNHPELKEYIHPIDILYTGTLQNLYPEVKITDTWHDEVLELLKSEKKFRMEENEPLCNNKVPREGIVIRIQDDPVAEAYKLKCTKFLEKESKEVSEGTADIESEQRY